jgi:hypothetical protein
VEEYDVLRGWIDNLSNISLALEATDTIARQITEDGDDYGGCDGDILNGYPALQSSSIFSFSAVSSPSATALLSFQSLPSLDIGSRPVIERFFPLWLSHPCLLQAFVSVPFRTKNNFACTIIKILRAQGGFDIEQECVAGMSEVRRLNSLGLIGIGMNMMVQQGLSLTALPSLSHVLQAWPSEFATCMLHISMRPMEHKGLLIGMATAFARMHDVMVKSNLLLLSVQDGEALKNIAQRELEGLELCWNQLKSDERMRGDFCKGYTIAGHEIEKSFRF